MHGSLHFVGALSPYQHKKLIREANQKLHAVEINGEEIPYYRVRHTIWQRDLTVVVYISEKLREGQLRGLEQAVSKAFEQLNLLRRSIQSPTKRGKKRTRDQVEKRISSILLKSLLPKNLIKFTLTPLTEDAFDLDVWIDEEEYLFLTEQWFGRRIIITSRHEWSTKQIIQAYWGQSHVEWAFKTIKNPFHLSLYSPISLD